MTVFVGQNVFPHANYLVGTVGTHRSSVHDPSFCSHLSQSRKSQGEQVRTNIFTVVPIVPTVPIKNKQGVAGMATFLTKWASAEPVKPTTHRSESRRDVGESASDAPLGPSRPCEDAERAIPPVSLHVKSAPTCTVSAEHESGLGWAEWKAMSLNRLFQEQGVTGQPGRITAATLEHGELGDCRTLSPYGSANELRDPLDAPPSGTD